MSELHQPPNGGSKRVFFLRAQEQIPCPACINLVAPPSHSAVVASTPLGTTRNPNRPFFKKKKKPLSSHFLLLLFLFEPQTESW